MAFTTGGALKAWIEGNFGLGLVIYRDRAPDDTQAPYITVAESVPMAPGPGGNHIEDGGPGTAIETCHIDLWQDMRKAADGTLAEDQTLIHKLCNQLHGKRPVDSAGKPIMLSSIPGGAGIIYRCKVASCVRMIDPSVENRVHHAVAVQVWRQF